MPLEYSGYNCKAARKIVANASPHACVHNWALLCHDTFTPVVFAKVSEHAGTFCESVGTKHRLPEHPSFVFCKLLLYHYFPHRIVFHA